MSNYTKQERIDLLNTIQKQLLYAKHPSIPMSWGIHNFIGTEYLNMVTLKFNVQGFLFEGSVLISYNEGLDLYEIRFVKDDKVISTVVEVYADMMVDVIDDFVETGKMTETQYRERVDKFLDSL